ncbi:MAG: DUF4288 domain-containing protein [Comamonadaceae bacterium]|nr:DUF4288 domain-containing protein [Comamonadaceae bacterium]
MTQDSKNKSYFSVSILFKSSIDGLSNDSSLWEEQIILVRALSEIDAQELAKNYAIRQETSYKNINNSTVEWKFFRIERIIDTGFFEIPEEAEIFSRFLKQSEAKSLLEPFD